MRRRPRGAHVAKGVRQETFPIRVKKSREKRKSLSRPRLTTHHSGANVRAQFPCLQLVVATPEIVPRAALEVLVVQAITQKTLAHINKLMRSASSRGHRRATMRPAFTYQTVPARADHFGRCALIISSAPITLKSIIFHIQSHSQETRCYRASGSARRKAISTFDHHPPF